MNGINDVHADTHEEKDQVAATEERQSMDASPGLVNPDAEELSGVQASFGGYASARPKRPPVRGGQVSRPPVRGGSTGRPPVRGGQVGRPPVRGGQVGKVPVRGGPPVRPLVKVSAPAKPIVRPSTAPLVRQTVPATPAPPSRLENVLTTVNTITGVLQLVPAFHHVVNRNGTVTYRDGRIQSADGQTLTHPDGAMQNVDGTTEHADGSIENANGDVLHKDGTWVLADGSISYPDGRWKLTDGRIIDAQGNVLGIAAPDAQL